MKYSFDLFQPYKNVKSILSLQAVPKQAACCIWWMGCSLLTFVLDDPTLKKFVLVEGENNKCLKKINEMDKKEEAIHFKWLIWMCKSNNLYEVKDNFAQQNPYLWKVLATSAIFSIRHCPWKYAEEFLNSSYLHLLRTLYCLWRLICLWSLKISTY